MAWLPEHEIHGPERPTVRDVEPLNRVFSDAFTDRYRRDGMAGVRVPHLNPIIWRYALEDAGDGAMVWRDSEGQLAGFNVVHQSGTEGWMGPLAVRPDRQGSGLGKAMIQAGISWLKERRVRSIGLETMPRTVENIGFYSRLGFVPGHLTVTLTIELPKRRAGEVSLLSCAGERRPKLLADCRHLTSQLIPDTDFTREQTLTQELKIGDTVLVSGPRGLRGFALCHSAPLAAGRSRDELRVLKLVAEDSASFDAVIGGVENAALAQDLRRVSVRCQTAFGDAYLRLIERGYRAHWTDLRMTLRGYPEPLPDRGVVLSNWEI